MKGLVITIAVGAAVTAGCAEATDPAAYEARVRDATQLAMGDALAGKQLTLSEIKTSPTRVEWKAHAGAETFACDADERFSLPACRPAT